MLPVRRELYCVVLSIMLRVHVLSPVTYRPLLMRLRLADEMRSAVGKVRAWHDRRPSFASRVLLLFNSCLHAILFEPHTLKAGLLLERSWGLAGATTADGHETRCVLGTTAAARIG